jgi:hypothetical protein
MIAAPSGATHFRIISAGASIDFEGQAYVMDNQNSAILPIDTVATAVLIFMPFALAKALLS